MLPKIRGMLSFLFKGKSKQINIKSTNSIITKTMTTQGTTLALIKQFEGCILHPYKDQAGVWTIGYGATYDLNGSKITEHSPTLTKEQADQLLEKQIEIYADAVKEDIKVPLRQNQFDACVSLCYNIGAANFAKSSVVRFCNQNNFKAAGDAFLLWNKAGGKVNQGLINRRTKERDIFLA